MWFARSLSNKHLQQLFDTGLDALKTGSKKIVYKAAEVAGKFLRNKITDKIVKPVQEIIIPWQMREKISI